MALNCVVVVDVRYHGGRQGGAEGHVAQTESAFVPVAGRRRGYLEAQAMYAEHELLAELGQPLFLGLQGLYRYILQFRPGAQHILGLDLGGSVEALGCAPHAGTVHEGIYGFVEVQLQVRPAGVLPPRRQYDVGFLDVAASQALGLDGQSASGDGRILPLRLGR